MAGSGRKPDANLPSGPDADGRAYAAMVAAARALIPRLRDRAARTEELRRLPAETERDLHDVGLFRIVQPKRVGGSEFDYVSLVDCADALGQADASVAWNFANLASHHWMLAMFDKRAQDLVWNKDADALIASSFIFPAGRARKVDGGYVLRGSWPFSSGGGFLRMEYAGQRSVFRRRCRRDRVPHLPGQQERLQDRRYVERVRAEGTGVERRRSPRCLCCRADDAGGQRSRRGPDAPAAPSIPIRSMRCRCSRCFPMCCQALRSAMRSPVLTITSISRGIAPRPITAPSLAISRVRRSRLPRLPRRSMRRAGSCVSNCIEALADARRGHIPDVAAKTRLRRDGAFSVNLCTEAVCRCCSPRAARGGCS